MLSIAGGSRQESKPVAIDEQIWDSSISSPGQELSEKNLEDDDNFGIMFEPDETTITIPPFQKEGIEDDYNLLDIISKDPTAIRSQSLYSGPKIKYFKCPVGERKTRLGFCQTFARKVKS